MQHGLSVQCARLRSKAAPRRPTDSVQQQPLERNASSVSDTQDPIHREYSATARTMPSKAHFNTQQNTQQKYSKGSGDSTKQWHGTQCHVVGRSSHYQGVTAKPSSAAARLGSLIELLSHHYMALTFDHVPWNACSACLMLLVSLMLSVSCKAML